MPLSLDSLKEQILTVVRNAETPLTKHAVVTAIQDQIGTGPNPLLRDAVVHGAINSLLNRGELGLTIDWRIHIPRQSQLDDEEPATALTVTESKIVQLVAVPAGWRAVYDDPHRDGAVVTFPICVAGIVDLLYEDGEQLQEVRHFVALPTGTICDVYEIDGFVCVVAPGQDLRDVVASVKAEENLM
jgi:hypothetical protein